MSAVGPYRRMLFAASRLFFALSLANIDLHKLLCRLFIWQCSQKAWDLTMREIASRGPSDMRK